MIDEPTLSQWLDQARTLVNEKKHLHALQMYYKITAAAPTLDIAWVELAYVQFELKQFAAAEKTLLRAVSTSSEPHEILFLVGNLYLKLNDFAKALTYYKKLLGHPQTLSKDLRAHLNYNAGLAYYYKDNIRLAEIHFRAARRIDPRFPKINESLGELLLRRGAFGEAADCLKESIANEQYSWIAHYLLGTAYAKMYDWRKAHDEFVVAIEMDPNEPRAWHMCGESLLALHKLDEAERYLRKALELNPQLTDAVVDFGFVFLRKGDYQRARELFEQALQVEPHHTRALQGTRELKQSQTPQS
ncbi:MAG TPA: tetratricopeptide repeat protein [Bacteroidota bacterium]|nr:tetratricopeptide repeat protein [Bacteroidota bacterium]